MSAMEEEGVDTEEYSERDTSEQILASVGLEQVDTQIRDSENNAQFASQVQDGDILYEHVDGIETSAETQSDDDTTLDSSEDLTSSSEEPITSADSEDAASDNLESIETDETSEQPTEANDSTQPIFETTNVEDEEISDGEGEQEIAGQSEDDVLAPSGPSQNNSNE